MTEADRGSLRVLLAGGGSGGSAAPVIAVAEALSRRQPQADFLYVGTRGGPERSLVEAAGLPYVAVPAGRLRRYLTWRNLVDPWLVLAGAAYSTARIRRFRPDLAFAAGGFATVPPLLAARLAGARVMIHQQDAVPGLANRMLAPFADCISTAFAETGPAFRKRPVHVLGNPVRSSILSASASLGREVLGLEPEVPLILAMGGGTGALTLNQLVVAAAPDLVATAQIVHLTGTGKLVIDWTHPRYHPFEFLTGDFPNLLAAADVVISRAGMSSLSEIAALGKPAIVVAMPRSHQEANAALVRRARAAIVIAEGDLTPRRLAADARALLADEERRRQIGAGARGLLPSGAADRIADELVQLATSR